MTRLGEIITDKSMRLIARGLAAGRSQTIASGVENIPAQGPAWAYSPSFSPLEKLSKLFNCNFPSLSLTKSSTFFSTSLSF